MTSDMCCIVLVCVAQLTDLGFYLPHQCIYLLTFIIFFIV